MESIFQKEQYSRMMRLLGEDALARLREMHVALFGLGGVGGTCAEALCRSGIGTLTVVDHDVFEPSNLNRQQLATRDTVGLSKTAVCRERLAAIDPYCHVICRDVFYLPETAEVFDFTQYDYVIDAIDTVTAKIALIARCRALGVPVISAMGAGNRLDPSMLRAADIAETSVDPLARVMRRELRKRGVEHCKVVYSLEPPMKPAAYGDADTSGAENENSGDGGISENTRNEGDLSAEKESVLRKRRKDTPGSAAFVPPAMGLALASEVVRDLLLRQNES